MAICEIWRLRARICTNSVDDVYFAPPAPVPGMRYEAFGSGGRHSTSIMRRMASVVAGLTM